MRDIARWVVRGALLVALSFASLNEIWSPDVVPNALLGWSLAFERRVDLDRFATASGSTGADPTADRLDREAYFFRACGRSTATEPPRAVRSLGGPPAPGPADRVCSIFPPGITLLALPVLLPAYALAGVPDLATAIRAGHLAAAIIEAAATLVLWSVLARFVSPRWAFALILLYALGTSVRTVASQALWQHAGVHLALAGGLWLVVRDGPVSRGRELLAGALLGLGAGVRQTTVLVAMGLGGLSPRRIALVLGGAAVGALPLLAWNALAYGSPLEQGYGAKPFDTSLPAGLYGLLLSPSRGLLVYTPYLAFGLAALVLAWRRSGEVPSRLRGLGLVWLATLLLYATYAEWWGGRVFGARFLDDLAPVLFVALAWGIREGLLASRRARWLFAILAGWSLVLFNAAALVYRNDRWDMIPTNVNFTPERLYDWTDPQWLAVLGDVPSGGVRAAVAAALTLLILVLFARLELRRSPLR